MGEVELVRAVTWLSWLHTAKLIAAFLVAVGVAVEFLGDWVARPFEKTVEAAREAEISRLSAEATIAKARAVEAQLELEKFRAPRALSSDQWAQVVRKVAPFAGLTFDVAANNAHEPLGFVDQIERTLVAAGWKQLDWTSSTTIARFGKPSVGMAVDTGISIQVEQSKQATLLPIAKELTAALNAEGIAARAEFMAAAQTPNHGALHIVVGQKPGGAAP